MREVTAGERWQRAGGAGVGWGGVEGAVFACDAKNKTCRAASESALEQTFI